MNENERNIVELYDENDEVEKYELLGEIDYEGNNYFIMSEYVDEETFDNSDAQISTYVMKNIGEDENDIQLEPVLDEELGLAVFNEFFNELKKEEEISDLVDSD